MAEVDIYQMYWVQLQYVRARVRVYVRVKVAEMSDNAYKFWLNGRGFDPTGYITRSNFHDLLNK